MDKVFIIYTATLVIYIIILFIFFWRREKRQEKQLDDFLEDAKKKLVEHKLNAKVQASGKVAKAFELIKRLQSVASDLESQAAFEYDQVINQAKLQSKDIINEAHHEASQIRATIETELEEYRKERQKEIERNLVKLVVSVSEKVVGKSLTRADHIEIIKEAVEEVKKEKGHF